MNDRSFDGIARTLGAVASRRTTLGRLGGGVVGAAVAGLPWPTAAAPCPRGRKRCGKHCIPNDRCCTSKDCAGCKKCGAKGRCQEPFFPTDPCNACEELRCDKATKTYRCVRRPGTEGHKPCLNYCCANGECGTDGTDARCCNNYCAGYQHCCADGLRCCEDSCCF